MPLRQTSKLFTEFPQKVSSKRTENIWCLFGTKKRLQKLLRFLVEKFSEAVNTEITTFSIIAWSDCRSWSQIKKNADSFSFSLDRRLSKLRIPLLQIQNNLNNRFAFSHRLDFLWAFSEHFWLPGIYLCTNFSMHKPGKIVLYKSTIIFRITWLFQRIIASFNIRFERSFLLWFD